MKKSLKGAIPKRKRSADDTTQTVCLRQPAENWHPLFAALASIGFQSFQVTLTHDSGRQIALVGNVDAANGITATCSAKDLSSFEKIGLLMRNLSLPEKPIRTTRHFMSGGGSA
jgi:hypothetical protein